MLLLETNLVRDDNTLEAMIAALPTSWKARILRKKSRFSRVQSAIAYTMLADILKNTYHLPALPAIETAANGKPYLVDCPLYFSISHCDAAVAVVVDTVPVGVDVQTVLKDISPALAARIAAPHDSSTMTATELTTLWTQKEASAKLDGGGLSLGLANLPFPEHILTTHTYDMFILTIAQ